MIVDFTVTDVQEDTASRVEVLRSQLDSGNVVMNIRGMPIAAYPNSTHLEVGTSLRNLFFCFQLCCVSFYAIIAIRDQQLIEAPFKWMVILSSGQNIRSPVVPLLFPVTGSATDTSGLCRLSWVGLECRHAMASIP